MNFSNRQQRLSVRVNISFSVHFSIESEAHCLQIGLQMTNDCKSSSNQNDKYQEKQNGDSNEFPLLANIGLSSHSQNIRVKYYLKEMHLGENLKFNSEEP